MFLSTSIVKKQPQRALNVAAEDKFIITKTDMPAAVKMFQFVFKIDRDTRVTLGQMTNNYVSINCE